MRTIRLSITLLDPEKQSCPFLNYTLEQMNTDMCKLNFIRTILPNSLANH